MNVKKNQFFSEISKFNFNEEQLSNIITNIFMDFERDYEFVNVIFTNDETLRRMKKEHLKMDVYTDVLTFQINDSKAPIEGEIYISVDRIREQAVEFSVMSVHETARLVIHGALHLCGIKDNILAEKKQMRNYEEHYLKTVFS